MSSLNAVDRCSQIQNLAKMIGFADVRVSREDHHKVRLMLKGITGFKGILIPQDISIEQLRIDLKNIKDHADQNIVRVNSLSPHQSVKIVATAKAPLTTDSTAKVLKNIENALERHKRQQDQLSLTASGYVHDREQQHAQSDGIDMTRKNVATAVQEYQKKLDFIQAKADQERELAIKGQVLKRDQILKGPSKLTYLKIMVGVAFAMVLAYFYNRSKTNF